MVIISLLGIVLAIFTLVHMWKHLDIKTIYKVLIAIGSIVIPFGFAVLIIVWWVYYLVKKPQLIDKYNKTENTETETATATYNEPADNIPPRKEFFLKRWLRQLVNWIDLSYFNTVDAWESPFGALCRVFATCFITGLFWWGNQVVTGEHNNFSLAVEVITGIIMLVILVLYVKDDVKRFSTTGMKVGRIFYIFFLFAISAAIGLILSGLVVVIFILYLVLSVMWMMIFGDGTKRKLSNGDTVFKDNGIFGSGNWKSTSILDPKEYEKIGDKYYEK